MCLLFICAEWQDIADVTSHCSRDMAVASHAIEAVCMPPIALAVASDAVRPVAVKFRIHQV